MENSDEPTVFLDRTSRPTRGKRMTKLLDDELEEDDKFWNQDALKEDEIDVNYEEEEEVADVFDSDFDEDETEPEDETEVDVDDRDRTKKKLIAPGKPAAKKKSKQKVLRKLEVELEEDKSSSQRQSDQPEQLEVPDDPEVERTVRKSTRTSVIVRQAERDAIRAALQATMRPIKRKKEGEEKRMTQEEMLLEAAETEIMNLRNLERVLAREEEVKKRAVVHKEVYSGPQTRYSSRDGKSFLEFSKGLSFQSQICAAPFPYPEKVICSVTGLPAKYRDPKTGLPYATIDAFKTIRESCQVEHNNFNKEIMDKGNLFESISGNGFLTRRRRSIPANTSAAGFRYGARFLTIPALEIEDTD